MEIKKLLLTEMEGVNAIDAWLHEDYKARAISLNRGHYEQLIPVIGRAQIEKIIREGGVIKRRDQGWHLFGLGLVVLAWLGFARIEDIEC